MGEIWILAIHKRGCGRPQVSEILCHLKRFSGPGMSWLLLCEWVTHSWHGSLSSDSSHCGTWAYLLIWGPSHTKISLNLRASAGQEERGLVTRGAHLLHCPRRATELPRHQTQDYFAELRTNVCGAAVTSIHKSIHDDVSTKDFFLNTLIQTKLTL